VTEDLGDYVEDINRRAAEGQRWQIYIRTLAAMFWTGVNALGYLFRNLRMKSGA
jgi:hypothetical protein